MNAPWNVWLKQIAEQLRHSLALLLSLSMFLSLSLFPYLWLSVLLSLTLSLSLFHRHFFTIAVFWSLSWPCEIFSSRQYTSCCSFHVSCTSHSSRAVSHTFSRGISGSETKTIFNEFIPGSCRYSHLLFFLYFIYQILRSSRFS